MVLYLPSTVRGQPVKTLFYKKPILPDQGESAFLLVIRASIPLFTLFFLGQFAPLR